MAVICPGCGKPSAGFDTHCTACNIALPLDSELTAIAGLEAGQGAGASERERAGQDALMGRSIGRFRIEGVLGRGGMGVVYLATDSKLERPVALKFISEAMAADPVARKRFEREAQAAARLDCPSVGTIYEIGQHRGRPWIAMAYYSGKTLAEHLEGGALSIADSLEIAIPLIEALDAAHRAGIVHRDVKPANIMLTADGKIKLLDFGLAKIETAPAMTRTNQALGTLAYMAPEQLMAEEIDARVDLWALAVVWTEMLTGRSPFRGGQGIGVIGGILDGEPELGEVPGVLRPILAGCLSKKAEDRPESMDVLRSELVAAGLWPTQATGSPGIATATAPSPPTAPRGDLAQGAPAPGTLLSETSSSETSSSETSPSESSSPEALSPAAPSPRRWLTGTTGALLLVAAVLATVFIVRSDRHSPPRVPSPSEATRESPAVKLRRVAVAPPRAEIAVPDADPEISQTGVRIALLRALTGLEGLRPLPPDQLAGLPGSVAEQAKAAGAEEVLTSHLRCEPRGCSLQLTLLRTDDKSVVWSDEAAFSWGDKNLAALATATTVRRAFPGHPAREEALRFEMDKEDFLELAILWHAYEKRSLPRHELLDRLSDLRRRAPGFVEIHLLEIDVARMLFFDTRDGAFLDHGSRLAEQARLLAPWDAMPLYKHFDLACEGRRIGEAEAVLVELERLRPGEAGVLHSQARLAEMKGDAETAIDKMTAAVELRPTWRRLQALANMEFRQGRTADARAHAEQLLALSPDNYEGLRLLANFELMTGQPEKAEALFQRLVADEPELPDLMALGTAHLLTRRYGDAELSFRQALELGDHPGVPLNLADCLALQGRHAEAEALYETTLERVAEDPAPGYQILLVKAQALAHLDRAGEAIAAAQGALTQMPNSAQVAYEISLVQAVIGERHSALLNAERALEGGVKPHWFELEWFDPLSTELGPLLDQYAE